MDDSTRVGNWPVLVDVYMCPALELTNSYGAAREKAKKKLAETVTTTLAIDAPVNFLWSGNSVIDTDTGRDTWTTLTLGVFFRNVTRGELSDYADKIRAALADVNLSMVDEPLPCDVEVATAERIAFLRSETDNARKFNQQRESGEFTGGKYEPSPVKETVVAASQAAEKKVPSIEGVPDGQSTRGMDLRDLF